MVAIVTTDLDLLAKIWNATLADKAFIAAAESAVTLCRELEELEPEVVVLDVRFCRNAWRALEAVPAIRRMASRPEVILLAPGRSARLEEVAAALDCYDVISLDENAWMKRFASVGAAALRACRIQVKLAHRQPTLLQ